MWITLWITLSAQSTGFSTVTAPGCCGSAQLSTPLWIESVDNLARFVELDKTPVDDAVENLWITARSPVGNAPLSVDGLWTENRNPQVPLVFPHFHPQTVHRPTRLLTCEPIAFPHYPQPLLRRLLSLSKGKIASRLHWAARAEIPPRSNISTNEAPEARICSAVIHPAASTRRRCPSSRVGSGRYGKRLW